MKKILYTAGLFFFYVAAYAQHIDPADLQAIDKPSAPKKDTLQAASGFDEPPEFPGGMRALQAYIMKNTKYPRQAKKDGIRGKVVLRYVIDKDGSVIDVIVVRGIGGGCDEEAVRVVKAMPKWKPGTSGGQPVKVFYTLPVSFTLQD